MIETATLITLCMLYLIFFRPGKTPPLENPLVIERPGEYHLSLAPQLNLAQSFIEQVASQVRLSDESVENTDTHFFEVRDNQVTAHGFDFYLLAVTRRNGMLLFQAARPQNDSRQFDVIGEFSHAVLDRFPDDEAHISGEAIVSAVTYVAQLRGIKIKALTD
ncbi:MAG: hypothetical protein PHP85_05830 [Gallionella sp.]|nr:hypothetical protein [Gallionella sp.]